MTRETRRGFLGKLLAAPVAVAAAKEVVAAPAASAEAVRYEPVPETTWNAAYRGSFSVMDDDPLTPEQMREARRAYKAQHHISATVGYWGGGAGEWWDEMGRDHEPWGHGRTG